VAAAGFAAAILLPGRPFLDREWLAEMDSECRAAGPGSTENPPQDTLDQPFWPTLDKKVKTAQSHVSTTPFVIPRRIVSPFRHLVGRVFQ
jgi:hypothetical protein